MKEHNQNNTPQKADDHPLSSLVKLVVGLVVVLVIIAALAAWAGDSSESDKQPEQEQQVQQENEDMQDQTNAHEQPAAVNSLDGIIEDVDADNNTLTVSFVHNGAEWKSDVLVTEQTFIGGANTNDEGLPSEMSLSDLTIGERVIVSSQEGVKNNETFEASGVVKMK